MAKIEIDLPDALIRRMDSLAAVGAITREELHLLAIDAACVPDYRKLQEVYALCERAK